MHDRSRTFPTFVIFARAAQTCTCCCTHTSHGTQFAPTVVAGTWFSVVKPCWACTSCCPLTLHFCAHAATLRTRCRPSPGSPHTQPSLTPTFFPYTCPTAACTLLCGWCILPPILQHIFHTFRLKKTWSWVGTWTPHTATHTPPHTHTTHMTWTIWFTVPIRTMGWDISHVLCLYWVGTTKDICMQCALPPPP